MSMLKAMREKQDAAVELLRKLQRDKTVAPPGNREVIEAEIVKKSHEITELDAVIADLINNGAPKIGK